MTAHAPAKKPSSSIAQSHYDSESQVLTVTFKGTGKTYQYAGVPAHTAHAMQEADSIGRFLNTHVVGKFKHTIKG
jgi:hypothetical protein